MQPNLVLNGLVSVRGCACRVRFIGKTDFADGQWIGVEFKTAVGRNDGSVRGTRYFQCAAKHGLFVQVRSLPSPPPPPRARTAITTPRSHPPRAAEPRAACR